MSGEAKGFKPRSRSESDMRVVALCHVARGLKGPGVTHLRPEAGRSSPGQGEARRKPRGGPLPVVRSQSLG